MAESFDSGTKATVQKLPLLTVAAGPREKDKWPDRLKQVRGSHGKPTAHAETTLESVHWARSDIKEGSGGPSRLGLPYYG